MVYERGMHGKTLTDGVLESDDAGMKAEDVVQYDYPAEPYTEVIRGSPRRAPRTRPPRCCRCSMS